MVDKILGLFWIQFSPGHYQADIDREIFLTGSDEIFSILMKTLFSALLVALAEGQRRGGRRQQGRRGRQESGEKIFLDHENISLIESKNRSQSFNIFI